MSQALSSGIPHSQVQLSSGEYNRWNDCIKLSNKFCSAIVVPQISGRVMSFAMVGFESAFWVNEAEMQRSHSERNGDYGNWGGDKSWPAPQANWKSPGNWPPPSAFDGSPARYYAHPNHVELQQPCCNQFGIRSVREVKLAPESPTMHITTRFQKESGGAVEVAPWVVTQLKLPEKISFAQPAERVALGDFSLPAIEDEGGISRIIPDKQTDHKVGLPGVTSLLWTSSKTLLLIESDCDIKQTFPDNNCSAEIYTGGGLGYVEFEFLAPLRRMQCGDQAEIRTSYTYFSCVGKDADVMGQRILQYGK